MYLFGHLEGVQVLKGDPGEYHNAFHCYIRNSRQLGMGTSFGALLACPSFVALRIIASHMDDLGPWQLHCPNGRQGGDLR